MKTKLILLLLLVISCAQMPVPQEKIPTKVIDIIKPIPSKKLDIINVTSFTNFTVSEKQKAHKYIAKMNEVAGSKCFEDFMLKRKMIQTDGLTNKQVVNKIRTTKVNVELIAYYKRFSRVAGYTYPNVPKIWLNRKFHAGASLCSEASNLLHESGHKQGFIHDFKATRQRPYSVPYSINAAFLVCCK